MVDSTDGNSPSPTTTEEGGKSAEVDNTKTSTSTDTIDSGADTQKDASSAESSDAGKKPDAKTEPRKLLDVVKDAVKQPEEKKGDSSTSEGTKDGKEAKPADSQEKKGEKKDDLPPFHNHPRWKEKLNEVATLTQQNEVLKRDADQYQVVHNFMQKNEISPTEVADGFKVMALMKKAPEAALVELEKYVQDIKLHLGKVLPEDLQKQVDDGKITEDAARELSLSRQKTASLEDGREADKRAREDDNRNRMRESTERLKGDIGSAMTAWEKQQAKDPDWAIKQPMVMDRITAIARELRTQDGRPRGIHSVEEARTIGEQALKDVEARIGKIAPNRKTEIRNVPSGGKQPAPGAPKTLKEAITQAVNAAA